MGVASTATAGLIDRGNGMIYDTDRNITWLADANLAATNNFGVSGIAADGSMNWNTAQSWVTAMDTANYLGFTNWRLPTTLQPDASCGAQSGGAGSYGFNCTGSELGHLFYQEIGATAGNSILTGNATELTKFSNIQSVYYSGTGVASDPFSAWVFGTSIGYLGNTDKVIGRYAWAVRTGDVTSTSVPEPGIIWLLLAGGMGWVGTRTRRRG